MDEPPRTSMYILIDRATFIDSTTYNNCEMATARVRECLFALKYAHSQAIGV